MEKLGDGLSTMREGPIEDLRRAESGSPGAAEPAARSKGVLVGKITPFLWYDTQAEEAAALYTSIFKDSRILEVQRYGDAGPGQKGTAMTVSFEIAGQSFIALNGGPIYKFTEAFSLYVNCETQKEVDELWEKLSEGGEKGRCGWLKDRYGLSWQIIPTALTELLGDPDPAKSQRVMQAMLQMSKIDIGALKNAHQGQ